MDIADELPVADARANLSEVVASVRLQRRSVVITSRGKPVATVIPVELGHLIRQAGGPDEAAEVLRRHLGLEDNTDD